MQHMSIITTTKATKIPTPRPKMKPYSSQLMPATATIKNKNTLGIAENKHKKLCYRRWTAQHATSVKILSTVETSCTTNPQQIAVMELEGYS